MTVTDHIRAQMYRRMGIDDQPKRVASEVSAEIAGMTRQLDEIVKTHPGFHFNAIDRRE